MLIERVCRGPVRSIGCVFVVRRLIGCVVISVSSRVCVCEC